MAKILVVDDDRDLVETIKTVLESKGYEVVVANSRSEGMSAQESNSPDLIILDVMMEEADDGFTMAQDLRRKGVQTPILMLTSVGKTLGMDFGKDNEMVPVDEYEEKPIKPEKLLSKVEELLGK